MSTYLAMTLDPLHIGAGGYRLGRVDNTIVRDAGSGLPKVPGTSLAGVARCNATFSLEEKGEKPCEDKNCGKCAICNVFGYAADGKNSKESHIGLIHFYDGQILAFPVRSMVGPVWVTCPSVLGMHGFAMSAQPGDEELLLNFEPNTANADKRINLGWLYLPCRSLKKEDFPDLGLGGAAQVVQRIAVAPDWLFGEIVNSNLEVRTSVCIDRNTGAAEEGKLFTYEAIPAATILAFDIEVDKWRCNEEWTEGKVRDLLGKALAMCETLGMGGMNTRGFGRVRFLVEGK